MSSVLRKADEKEFEAQWAEAGGSNHAVRE